MAAQKLLADQEGIFCEPASATSLAGVIQSAKANLFPAGSKIVCTLTGHGLKDPDVAIKQSTTPLITVDANMTAVKNTILQNMAT